MASLIDELRSSGSKLIDSLKVDLSVPPVKQPEVTPVPQSPSGQALIGGLENFAAGFGSDVRTQAQDPRFSNSLPFLAGAAIASSPFGEVPKIVSKVPKALQEGKKVIQEVPGVFSGLKSLTLKTLEKLKGRTTVSKQFISDLTNAADIKQPERDLLRRVLNDYSSVPKELEPLAQEARKYKSAEEFVRAIKNRDIRDLTFGELGKIGTIDVTKEKALLPTQQTIIPQLSESTLLREKQRLYDAGKKAGYAWAKKPFESQTVQSYLNKQAQENVAITAYRTKMQTDKASLQLGKSELSKSLSSSQNTTNLTDNQLTDFYNQAVKGDQIPVKEFANKVETELLPLERTTRNSSAYESISLPSELRGPIANYNEHIYQSPIKTSAGDVHFPDYGKTRSAQPTNGYFAHTRIEDLPPEKMSKAIFDKNRYFTPEEKEIMAKATGGDTRRVIEIQSDLFQKGRLEGEFADDSQRFEDLFYEEIKRRGLPYGKTTPKQNKEIADFVNAKIPKEKSQLEPYRNIWHERVIREEIKQAAKDGKTKLQFPTGETAMKIEGLGQGETSFVMKNNIMQVGGEKLTADTIKPNQIIYSPNQGHLLITENLGEGKFKAMPYRALELENIEPVYKLSMKKGYINKETGDFDFERAFKDKEVMKLLHESNSYLNETYDISKKVDTNNPIYKFYEKDVQKYLNKFGGKKIVDPQGVSWIEIPITKDKARLPIEAFGVLPAIPLIKRPKDKKEK